MSEETEYDNIYFSVMGPMAGLMMVVCSIFGIIGWFPGINGYEDLALGVICLIFTWYPISMTGYTNEKFGYLFQLVYSYMGIAEALFGLILIIGIYFFPFICNYEQLVLGIIILACGIAGLLSKAALRAKLLFSINILIGLFTIYGLSMYNLNSVYYLFLMLGLNLIFIGIPVLTDL